MNEKLPIPARVKLQKAARRLHWKRLILVCFRTLGIIRLHVMFFHFKQTKMTQLFSKWTLDSGPLPCLRTPASSPPRRSRSPSRRAGGGSFRTSKRRSVHMRRRWRSVSFFLVCACVCVFSRMEWTRLCALILDDMMMNILCVFLSFRME